MVALDRYGARARDTGDKDGVLERFVSSKEDDDFLRIDSGVVVILRSLKERLIYTKRSCTE